MSRRLSRRERKRLRKLHALSRHHRRPLSRQGGSSWHGQPNISYVHKDVHALWHAMFGNMTAEEIAEELAEIWLEPGYRVIIERR